MSSSMFIESSSLPAESNDYTSTSDSNLVVVYGKKGINFDDKGLENLIDEKKISSISVIRLTSPTPSMEDEEEEEANLEEIIRRQELDSDNDSSGLDDNSILSDDERYDTADNVESSDDDTAEQRSMNGSDVNPFEDKKIKNKIFPRRRGRQTNATKQKKLKRKRMRERPEIVGLRFEEFYPPDDANQIIKEALKMAGLGPDRKSKADYEFQLLVIKNDHCYTPFTSPSQMKAKLAADKLELEKQSNNRKIATLQTSTGKQLFVRKKALQRTEIMSKCSSSSSLIKDKSNISLVSRSKKDCKDMKSQPEDDSVEDDVVRTSMDENDDAKAGGADEENESDESDNDRDSDLDFDVNNPKGRRRKIKLAKIAKRPAGTPKMQQKSRRIHTQEELAELPSKTCSNTAIPTIHRQKSVFKNLSDAGRITIRSTPTKLVHAGGCVSVGGSGGQTNILSPMIAALPPIPRKQSENKLLTTPTATNIQNKSVVLKTNSGIQTLSPQTHKEILIHKQIMSSPKTRGFTDLNTLMDQHDKKETVAHVAKLPSSKHSNIVTSIIAIPKTTASLKVFMPLGVETAAKNQLPAQISIQTHQSSSELEAEHDKQLDLINSIVQDEMKKSNEILMPAAAANIMENIPELVKMLESTESTMVSKMSLKNDESNVDKIKDSSISCDNPNIGDSLQPENNNTTISDIDINHASLLATPDVDDDLPDDILQQVVDMIKDDKTLQEAVDVLGAGDCTDPISSTSNVTRQNPPPLAPISQQVNNKNILEDIPHSSKSIIQMSISNVSSTTASPRSVIIPNRAISNQAIKTYPLIRREPIQIVRGNGRVITLPPIEAPTTRAKRRAQALPPITASAANNSPSSSGIPTNVSEASLDSSMHSSSSLISIGGSVNIVQEKKLQDSTNRRRGSKESLTTAGLIANQKTKRSSVSKKANRPQIDPDESGSGDEDDDDPNKLWCICRQPHNNRFMICCDACEDWFHGTCVNITKAMGLEMEQKGIDWTCPKCIRKHEEQKQPKITDLLIRKPVAPVVQLSEAYAASRIISKETSSVAMSVVTGSLQQEVTKLQPKEMNQNFTETLKPKIQSGHFINIKDLSGKKVIIQAATSGNTAGQKKLFVTTAQPLRTATINHGTSIRTFTVVKQISCQGKQGQHQNIKVIKTISPAQSTTQNVTVTNIGNTITSNETSTACIVCKKMARPNSIYCNDDCIRKHSQTAWNDFISKSLTEISSPGCPLSKSASDDKAKKKSKGLFEEVLSMADRKTKMERAIVFERKSGRILTGSSAPTFSNLKKWLLDNPTFEAIQPGSAQATDIEKKQKVRIQHSSSPTVLKATTSPPPLQFLPFSSPVQQKAEIRSNSPQAQASLFHKHALTPQPKPNRTIPDLIKNSDLIKTTSVRPGTPKQLQKYPQQVAIKIDKTQKSYDDIKSPKEKIASTKRPVNTEVVNKSAGSDGDIRLVVRRTLNEQLLLRIKDEDNTKLTDTPKLTPGEIEEFAKATELEMYNYFNRDTGIKYKAKYRSLVFNIKDRKNHTLYAKICGKLIEPKQLVRMSPEELASQELAQWREQETKHQLEMIKKSELDLLACAKNYVLKTHKGEEVIEGKSSEFENVDITIPVEDVVSTLNKSDFFEEATTNKSQAHWSDVEYTSMSHGNISDSISHSEKPIDEDKFKSSNTHNKDKDRERDKEKDKHREREREREREKRHKSKDRYRDKSRSRKRSRSHSRSRSRDRNEKRHKSSHKEEKRDREKDRVKDRSERDQQGDSNDKKSLIERKTVNTPKPRESFSIKRQTHDQHSNPLETYNLVDQILESTKTVEEAANIVSDRNKDIDNVRKTPATSFPPQSITSTTNSSSDTNSVIDIPVPSSYVESDQEPTSTVSIPTPPHDPYARFISLDSPSLEGSGSNRCDVSTLWTGNINMVDVTSFHLCLQPVLGNYIGLSKLLAKELDVVGRIGSETVWDYISKIKKSPNKEIVIIRLLPASETETAAYKLLYEYLDIRSRLGVIKSVSPFIKDFYIYPLGSGKQMPVVLRPSESVEFYDDPCRPDVLIGIIIRVVGKRHNTVSQQSATGVTDTSATSNKFINRTNEVDSNTPPGSPKQKKRRQSIVPKDIDVDAIIKAPIVSKSHKASSTTSTATSVSILKDDNEPYSPGGSSDDDLPLLPIKLSTVGSNQMQTAEEELKRKMEEINRQIAAQEMEIAGLLTGESTKFTASATTSKVLANIAIPSNLSQILASIKPTLSAQEAQPAVPPPPPLIGSLIKTSSTLTAVDEEYNPAEPIDSSYESKNTTSSSRLAKLSEAELLSMVPDDIVITSKTPAVRYEEPPPPGV